MLAILKVVVIKGKLMNDKSSEILSSNSLDQCAEDMGEWNSLLNKLNPQKKSAILEILNPSIPEKLKVLHEKLYNLHRPFKLFLRGTQAEFAQFPSAGIPAQSKAIAQHVMKEFNAGIGIAHDPNGHILAAPFVNRFIDELRPVDCNESVWQQVRNELLKYTSSLGAPWYRRVARLRYLNDGKQSPDLLALMEGSLVVDPLPCYGGTSALSLVFWLFGGPGCPVIFPRTYWGNMNLKCRIHGMQPELCDYLDIDGQIDPIKLRASLHKLRDEGYSKAIVYFNFPHNPTGSMPEPNDAIALGDICREMARDNFAILALSDEPYYPFVRGKLASRIPFSYYLQPLDNMNMITAVSINGTKRDGIYGFRHSDLIFQYPHQISCEAVNILEKDILQGLLRGIFSFSNVLNQYIIGRGLTQNPLIPLMNISDIELCMTVLEEEQLMVDAMANEVVKTSTLLSGKGFENLNRVGSDEVAGGFFVSYKPDNSNSKSIHESGLKNQCGVIAAGDYVRINALLPTKSRSEFSQNLKRTLDSCQNDNKNAPDH